MAWINCFAGDTAFQKAEKQAKEFNGYSVNADSIDLGE